MQDMEFPADKDVELQGILDESLEARKVKDELIRLMKSSGHIVYDCTYNGNARQNTILSKIVANCNAHTVDLDISIHLNSGRNDYGGDTSTGGSATSAVKLDSSAGSATQPVYFSGGKPVACTYTLGKSVPSNAVFTDTNTWRGIQNNLTSDSTTDSLSAAQGKVLKGLVDGKAASMISYCPSTSSAGVSKTVTIKGNFYNYSTSWYIQDLVRFTFYKVKLKSTSHYGSGVYSYCVYSLSGNDIWLDTSGETSLVGISTSINDKTTSNGAVERTITLRLTLGSYGWFNIEYNSSKYKVTIV